MSDERPQITYLNTDLDLIADRDLTPLASALESRGVCPLHVSQASDGLWYSTLEVDWAGDVPSEPELAICLMLDAIEAIDGEAKALWADCRKRELNIGYDCGDEPWAFNNGLTHSTLTRMANVGASLRITIYPQRPPA